MRKPHLSRKSRVAVLILHPIVYARSDTAGKTHFFRRRRERGRYCLPINASFAENTASWLKCAENTSHGRGDSTWNAYWYDHLNGRALSARDEAAATLSGKAPRQGSISR